ncbi:MAG: hypothetical protein ACLP5H_30400 [Desulfomonilaceae bacterium]
MPKTERGFRDWAKRIGLPDAVCRFFVQESKLRLDDLAITANILKCSTDELLYGMISERQAAPAENQLYSLIAAQVLHNRQPLDQKKSKPEPKQTAEPRAAVAEHPTSRITATLEGLDEFCLPGPRHMFQQGVPVRVSWDIAMQCTELVGLDGGMLFRLEPHPDADIFRALGIGPVPLIPKPIRKQPEREKRCASCGQSIPNVGQQLEWENWPPGLDDPVESRLRIIWGGKD